MGKSKKVSAPIVSEILEVPVEVSAEAEVPAEIPAEEIVEVPVVSSGPKVSLVSQIIKTMNDNHDKSMKETVDIMVATLALESHRKLASARSYYRELVNAGRATGIITDQKVIKEIKAPKTPKAQVTLAGTPAPAPASEKTPEIIAKITAANKARMNKIMGKTPEVPAQEEAEEKVA